MKIALKFYHFLGGIYFAICLIGLVALFVTAGTLLESKTQSHLFAAYFTYENPIFKSLLWLFFINILFAALRRWPFQRKHFPFLMTHLGLLLILSGALVKSYFGLQGHMTLLEGSGSQTILIPGSFALHIEKKGTPGQPTALFNIPLHVNWQGKFLKEVNNAPLEIEILDTSPHASQQLQFWFKDQFLTVAGLPPLPTFQFDPLQESLPLSANTYLPGHSEHPWKIYAFHTDNLDCLLKKIYTQEGSLQITMHQSPLKFTFPLKNALKEALKTDAGTFSTELHLQRELLKVTLQMEGGPLYETELPLSGKNALLQQYPFKSSLKQAPFDIDLILSPTLLFIKDAQKDEFLFLITTAGEIYQKSFQLDNLPPAYVFDRGFQGYGLSTELPLHLLASSREELEAALQHQASISLQEILKKNEPLTEPLKSLQEACSRMQIELAPFLLSFFKEWRLSHSWLYPAQLPLSSELSAVFSVWKIAKLPQADLQGGGLICQFFQSIEGKSNDNLLTYLTTSNWPLLNHLLDGLPPEIAEEPLLDEDKNSALLFKLTRLLYSLGKQLPTSFDYHLDSSERKAALLSALLRVQGLEHSQIIDLENDQRKLLIKDYRAFQQEALRKPMELICKITPSIQPLPPLAKLEDNCPSITLKISDGRFSEVFALHYDPTAAALKWPALNGRYLLRFQPEAKQIPYRIRLRDARQISYTGSQQPYSFESDLLITENSTSAERPKVVEKTISMNNVHETWDGYRFYMASLHPVDETAAQRAQIIVNRDPGKYYLTYPGAMILTLGILLLFWKRPYAHPKEP